MTANGPHLRFITYMCPSSPVEYYEAVIRYVEEKTGYQTSLVYETRGPGPLADMADPFASDFVDIAFMSTTAYLKLKNSKNKYMELLPVTSVHRHWKNTRLEPGYYSDIIIAADAKDRVKEFYDLRGCKWACNDLDSFSGNITVLHALKLTGENASFFGNVLMSGSHINSVQMVLQKQADAAAVDANALASYLSKVPQLKDHLHILDSIGLHPPYPIVINSRLPDELKTKITSHLLSMHEDNKWRKQLATFGVVRFVSNDPYVYQKEQDIREAVQDMSLGIRYY